MYHRELLSDSESSARCALSLLFMFYRENWNLEAGRRQNVVVTTALSNGVRRSRDSMDMKIGPVIRESGAATQHRCRLSKDEHVGRV